jgi:hypothetical protein
MTEGLEFGCLQLPSIDLAFTPEGKVSDTHIYLGDIFKSLNHCIAKCLSKYKASAEPSLGWARRPLVIHC